MGVDMSKGSRNKFLLLFFLTLWFHTQRHLTSKCFDLATVVIV